MKAKLLASLLVIGLVAALIGGATMAWFTDEAEVAEAEFVAGTVVINADKGEEFINVPDGKSFNNVNPGDCARVTWVFENAGTKAIELRVKLTELWQGIEGESLSTDNVFFAPLPDSGWVMYEDEDGEIWLYYANGPVRGTFNYENEEEPLAPEKVTLTLVVGFDGEATDNDYQGATYILGGSAVNEETGEIIGSVVEAVQASNNAPEAVWGEDFWNAVQAAEGLYAGEAGDDNLAYVNAMYFLDGPGYNMHCWPKDEEQPPEPPVLYDVIAGVNIEGAGSVTGADTGIEPGTPVSLTATASEGYVFTGWSLPDGLALTEGTTAASATISFIMPEYDVNVTANFEAIDVPEPQIASFDYKITNTARTGKWIGPAYYPQSTIYGFINNLKYDNGNPVSGPVDFEVIIENRFGYEMAKKTFTGNFDGNGNFYFNSIGNGLVIDGYDIINTGPQDYRDKVYIRIGDAVASVIGN